MTYLYLSQFLNNKAFNYVWIILRTGLTSKIPSLPQVPLAENLADMLLQPKAAQRLSAEQALAHRYFAELPPAIHDLGDGELIKFKS